MDYDQLIQSEENEVLGHAVFRGHTLGYLFRIGNTLHLGILHTSILKGSSYSNLTGSIMILPQEFKDVRKATQKDFDDFNVSSKGHLIPVK